MTVSEINISNDYYFNGTRKYNNNRNKIIY